MQINRRLRETHPQLVADVVRLLQEVGATVVYDSVSNQITVNGEFRVAISLSRCRQTPTGTARWRVQVSDRHVPDITVVARMNRSNDTPADYYLLPHLDVGRPSMYLRESNHMAFDTYRFDTLSYLAQMARRRKIEVAA